MADDTADFICTRSITPAIVAIAINEHPVLLDSLELILRNLLPRAGDISAALRALNSPNPDLGAILSQALERWIARTDPQFRTYNSLIELFENYDLSFAETLRSPVRRSVIRRLALKGRSPSANSAFEQSQTSQAFASVRPNLNLPANSEQSASGIATQFAQRLEALELQMQSLAIDLSSTIPPGFIYFQLPTQIGPRVLWPQFNWDDITEQYEGLFFRAYGSEQSEPFSDEEVVRQPPAYPELTISYNGTHDPSWRKHYAGQAFPGSLRLTAGTDSTVLSGFHHSDGGAGCWTDGMKFQVTNDEVRPLNTAIRIWKRSE